MYLLSIFALISSSIVFYQQPNLPARHHSANGSVHLTISDIRSEKGSVLISLFNQEDGFPSDSSQAYRTFLLEARKPVVELQIENLIPGEYAIAVIHDENKNFELGTNMVGAPLEGYGASGKNHLFRAPRFATSKFSVSGKPVEINISLNYLF